MKAIIGAPPTVEEILTNKASSSWIRIALESSLERDPIDALNDALALVAALDAHLRRVLGLEEGLQRHSIQRNR